MTPLQRLSAWFLVLCESVSGSAGDTSATKYGQQPAMFQGYCCLGNLLEGSVVVYGLSLLHHWGFCRNWLEQLIALGLMD
jgi:hypothetical protein